MKASILSLVFTLVYCQSAPEKFSEIKTEQQMVDSEKHKRAVYASGCFWGTEYYLQRAEGVASTNVGYTGGHLENPTYEQICRKNTGHYEAVEVWYDPEVISYEELTKLFFETHDPTQTDGQGPDIGPQYRSAIFYANEEEKKTAEKLIEILESKGLEVATDLLLQKTFYPAELYHQDYYNKKGGTPYCHAYTKRF